MSLVTWAFLAATGLSAPRGVFPLPPGGPARILRTRAHPTRTLLGDFEPPDAVLVTYTETWPVTFPFLVETLAPLSRVLVLVEEGHEPDAPRRWWRRLDPSLRPQVQLVNVITDSPWIRDFGPLQVRTQGGGVVWLDADYSDSRRRDDSVPTRVARKYGLSVERLEATIDGGAITSNGDGLCVSTLEYFEDNGLPFEMDVPSEADLSEALLQTLGCRVLALVPALSREGTGHADVFSQFLDANTVAVARFDPELAPEDASRMDVAASIIQSAGAVAGRRIAVHRIHNPAPLDEYYYEYVNVLHVGETILFPSYGDDLETDESQALADWARAAPDLHVIRIPAVDLHDAEGAIHCATLGLHMAQTTPRAIRAARGVPRQARRSPKRR